MTNSVRYGSSAGAEIVMLAALESNSLTITISDQGTEAANESDPGLGLGLMIMSAVASHVQVTQVARGTTVTLTFSWEE